MFIQSKLVRVAWLLLASLLFFSYQDDALAQRMNKKACQNADWLLLGAEDALKGRYLNALEKREKSCARADIPIDIQAWQRGYETMTPVVCAPDFAYGLGKYGNALEVSCQAGELPTALAANNLGRDYYRARRDYDNAVEAYNRDVRAIEQAQSNINRSQRRLSKKELSPKKVAKIRKQIHKNKDRIYELESSLNSKLNYVDQTERAFERIDREVASFEASLQAEGAKRSGGLHELQEPVFVSGILTGNKNTLLSITTTASNIPILFKSLTMRPDSFVLPRREQNGGTKCKVQRKTRRALSKQWKALKDSELSLEVYELDLVPPTYRTNYKVTLFGNAYLPGNVNLVDYFIERRLAVRADELPLNEWYKNKDCFSSTGTDDVIRF